MGYLDFYLERIRQNGNCNLAAAIEKTVGDVLPQYIEKFSCYEHDVKLLFGDVQSGKTSHVLGIVSAMADETFRNFIFLTTDNIRLQKQTITRVKRDLCEFCVCDENDYIRYEKNNFHKPVIVVLKKNSRILNKWRNHIETIPSCFGQPLFIVDDEADASSLNTLVNKGGKSKINKALEDIKKRACSSIYLEVTGTPQAVLLQSVQSGWKPDDKYYFNPGKGYLGGNFFFSQEKPEQVIFTENDELADILDNDEFPKNGLKEALLTHLISSGHSFLSGEKVCNFMIHPSMQTELHNLFAEKVGNYLNEFAHSYSEPETKETLAEIYKSLRQTKNDIKPLDVIMEYIIDVIQRGEIKILVINSQSVFFGEEKYHQGINIIVGGNSLGRGITFPKLQTIYYCRVSKTPQADTMWQHARMFGYDRDIGLLRLFMPENLFKIFRDINATNNSIIRQIKKRKEVKIILPVDIKPTRKNVIDRKNIGVYCGGVNYFPLYPLNKDISCLDNLLEKFIDGEYDVNLTIIVKILSFIESEGEDWNSDNFIGFINALIAKDGSVFGKLIIRRDRNIGRGTGTLLSPTDRNLGEQFPDVLVLTLYKITGNIQKGWNGEKIWIPNIKLPGDNVYYSGIIKNDV